MVPVSLLPNRDPFSTKLTSTQHPHKNHNLPLNHIGVAVDDIDRAAEWYGRHFGFRRIKSDRTTDGTQDSRDQPIFRIYGDQLQKVKICWLVAGDGVGFELFEFIDPPVESAEKLRRDFTLEHQYQRGGVFHIGFTAPDPGAVGKRAVEDGAVQIGETVDLVDGETALYLRDPWGLVIEVLSCSYEQLLGNRN